jgi:hypothetical protein
MRGASEAAVRAGRSQDDAERRQAAEEQHPEQQATRGENVAASAQLRAFSEASIAPSLLPDMRRPSTWLA